ncbi:MAG: DNA-binding response regulator [Chloroflexota bacterium]|nr:MAG: DNA-binding response regulator [Chloroflexota bacterium]
MKPVQSGNILVVDDEETMRRSLADILRLEGYKVQAVASGDAAVSVLEKETIDLVLLDLKMPGMDGLDVLQIASQIAPDTMVILLTAHGSLESAIEALRHEAIDYLLKPSSPQQIIKSVERALARRAESKQRRLLLEQLDSSIQQLKGAEMGETRLSEEKRVIALGNGVVADLERRQLWRGENPGDSPKVTLTPAEGKLLKVLLENFGRVMTHRELVLLVQGYDVTDWEAPEVLRPLVSRLRQKLANFPGGEDWIINVRGTGYVFDRRGREGID